MRASRTFWAPWCWAVSSCVLAACLFAACSLELDWDPGRLACDASGSCLQGYTCLDQRCVANNSRDTGESCNQQLQCGGGTSCTVSYDDRPCNGDAACFTCSADCALSASLTASACGAHAYCSSFCTAPLSPYTPQPPSYVACPGTQRAGVCVPSAGCEANTACTLVNPNVTGVGHAQGVCVNISSSATACLQACSFDFNRTTNKDGCGSTTANNFTCQPAGVTGQQQLVCIAPIVGHELPTGSTGCDLGLNICTPGNACVSGVCRVLCNVAAPNCGTQKCDALSGLAPPPPGIVTSGVGYCH